MATPFLDLHLHFIHPLGKKWQLLTKFLRLYLHLEFGAWDSARIAKGAMQIGPKTELWSLWLCVAHTYKP